jgi:hypothetical protein
LLTSAGKLISNPRPELKSSGHFLFTDCSEEAKAIGCISLADGSDFRFRCLPSFSFTGKFSET